MQIPENIFFMFRVMFKLKAYWKSQKQIHPVLFKRLVILKGDIGCPFSTSWYDPLGSLWNVCNILWLKFLNGHVKQHPFYLVQNSSVDTNPFRCMSHQMIASYCSPSLSLRRHAHGPSVWRRLLLTPPLSSVWIATSDSVYGSEVVLYK